MYLKSLLAASSSGSTFLLSEIQKGEFMLLKDAFDLFMLDRSTYCAGKSLTYYDENVGQFLNYLSGNFNIKLNELDCSVIDRRTVQEYILYLRSRNIKNTSINTYFRAVKAFLNWCIDEGYCCSDCLRKVRMQKNDAAPIIPLYQIEVDSIDQCFDMDTEAGLRNYCMVHLMLDAGFRTSDVVNLKTSGILFDKNYMQVKGKGQKFRSVLLAPKVKLNIYNYLMLYTSYLFDSNLNQPVFLSLKGSEYITVTSVRLVVQKLKEKTGIKRLHPHLLRHTFATSYILGGGNMEFLRLMLGHSDYDTTRMYLHLASEAQMLGHDIYKLDPIFFKSVY